MSRKNRYLLAAFLTMAVCLGVLLQFQTKTFAQGSTNTVTLTYEAGDGSGDNAVTDPVEIGTTATEKVLTFEAASAWSHMTGGSSWTAPAGETFMYWLANDMNLTHYKPGDDIPLDGSVSMLTAVYGFSLTYEAGEGTGGLSISDLVAPSKTVTSEAITFDVASLWSQSSGGSAWKAPAGKTFSYWIANDMNLTQYKPGDQIPLDGSVTVLSAFYKDTSSTARGFQQIADKTLSGGTLTNEQFSFTLTPLKAAVPGANGYYIKGDSGDVITLKNDAKGAVSINQDAVFTQAFHDKYCYDNTNSNNIYNGAYAFILQEVDGKVNGYTYDSKRYVISILYLDGQLLDVSAQKFNEDSAGHYTFSMYTDTLYDKLFVSKYYGVFTDKSAKEGYVPFINTFTASTGGQTTPTPSQPTPTPSQPTPTTSQPTPTTSQPSTTTGRPSSTGGQTTSPAASSKPGSKSSSTGNKPDTSTTIPATADSANTVIWIALMGISVCGFFVILLASKKRIR